MNPNALKEWVANHPEIDIDEGNKIVGYAETWEAELEAVKAREEAQWRGKRVCMGEGCIRDERDWPRGEKPREPSTIVGTALGEPVVVEQEWLPVLWDDDEDPTFCKLGCLRLAASEPPGTARPSLGEEGT